MLADSGGTTTRPQGREAITLPITISVNDSQSGFVSAFFGPRSTNPSRNFPFQTDSENIRVSTSGDSESTEAPEDPSRFQFDNPLKSLQELREEKNRPQLDVLLGSRLEELTDDETLRSGGTFGSVSQGSVTLSNDQGNSLKIDSDEPLRFFKNSNGSITIQNLESEKSITVQPENTVSVEGSGSLNIFGGDQNLRFESGEEIRFQSENDSLSVVNPSSVESINLGTLNSITVKSNSNNSTEELSLISGSGGSITFAEGETGTITRSQDGTITVKNDTTGESTQFAPGDEISIGGAAEGQIRSGSTNGTIELEEGVTLNLQSPGENGQQTLRNESSIPSANIRTLEEGKQPQRPVKIRTFDSPGLLSEKAVSEGLLGDGSGSNDQTRKLTGIINNQKKQQNGVSNDNTNRNASSSLNTNQAKERPVAKSLKNSSDKNLLTPEQSENKPTAFPERNGNLFIQSESERRFSLNNFLTNNNSRSKGNRFRGINQNQAFPANLFNQNNFFGPLFSTGGRINFRA